MKSQILLFVLWIIAVACQQASQDTKTDPSKSQEASRNEAETTAPQSAPKKDPASKASKASREDETTDPPSTTKEDPASKTPKSKVQKPRGNIYRCDGFRPGMVSEWLQIAFDNNNQTIEDVWYWNVQDTNKKRLTIHQQKFSAGEISGFTAKVSFPGDKKIISLGIVEDKANLVYNDKQFQEFEYESTQ